MECFLCASLESVNLKILNTTTKYQKIPISSMLHAFAGNDNIEIAITNTDSICVMCKLLLDELDCMHDKLQNIQNTIAYKLHRKYQFDDDQNTLPVIRFDAETIQLYTRGKNEHHFQCVQCAFSTDFQDCLFPHRLYHQYADSIAAITIAANGDFLCENCQLILPSKMLFDQHMTTFHTETMETMENQQLELGDTSNNENNDGIHEKPFQCPQCEKTFANEQKYAMHMSKGHFNCDKCNQKCRSSNTLSNHIALKHTQYSCSICCKQFSSRITFNAHQTTHGFNHNFICAYCNKGFRSKSLLASHIVMHSKEMNFTCHICGQRFVHQRAHRLHVQWHENPRPHKCPWCAKAFTHSSHLAVHRRIHTGERPKVCPLCDRRFINATKLKAHFSVHTKDYPHSCAICQMGYDKRYKLAKHMLRTHNNNTMMLNNPKCQYKLIVNPNFERVQ